MVSHSTEHERKTYRISFPSFTVWFVKQQEGKTTNSKGRERKEEKWSENKAACQVFFIILADRYHDDNNASPKTIPSAKKDEEN